MTLEEYLQIFRENSDEKFNDFNRKITNSSLPSVGCTVPFVRHTAKKYGASDKDNILSLPDNVCYEIDLLKGMVISNLKLSFADKKVYLDRFADKIENWAVCDVCVSKPSAKENENYFNYFLSLAKSRGKVFAVRYGLVSLLASFLDESHIDRVLESLEEIDYGEYYTDMAVAWLLSSAMIKCRDKTVKYLNGRAKEVLNDFTYKKSLQKIRDSFRVSAEDKLWTKSLKK